MSIEFTEKELDLVSILAGKRIESLLEGMKNLAPAASSPDVVALMDETGDCIVECLNIIYKINPEYTYNPSSEYINIWHEYVLPKVI